LARGPDLVSVLANGHRVAASICDDLAPRYKVGLQPGQHHRTSTGADSMTQTKGARDAQERVQSMITLRGVLDVASAFKEGALNV
jgi:hypothetical protein